MRHGEQPAGTSREGAGGGRAPQVTRLPLVLASASPQRRAILERLRVNFTVRPTDVKEIEQGPGVEVALGNALSKAQAAQMKGANEAVLGVDTIVELDGVLYGKPADEQAAAATLMALSGATHTVHSGVALLLAGEHRTAVASTKVSFREIDEALLRRSLDTGQWRGRSGAYAIQGMGVALVRRIEGEYENVVGLPVATLIDLWPQLLAV